jgi:hypothetical protein
MFILHASYAALALDKTIVLSRRQGEGRTYVLELRQGQAKGGVVCCTYKDDRRRLRDSFYKTKM